VLRRCADEVSLVTNTKTGFAEVNGARLYYEMAGEGHPLLLIHGGLADSRMWDDQFQMFAEHYRVIRYDMRGFGRSEIPAGEFAHHEDAYGLLKALGVERAHVLGLSFAGLVAIDLALTHPDVVDRLLLVGSALGGYGWSAETRQMMEEADAAFESGDLERAVEIELRWWIDGPRRTPEQVRPDVRERTREMNRHNWQIASDAGTPQELDPPAITRLAEIRAPTLIVVGDEDVADIHEIARLLERDIPQARTVHVASAAHHPNMEKPEEFNRLVMDFLA
jgi:pimeloyl-ACP methyl ester carboxylesterase